MKMKDLALAQVRRGERFTLDGVEFVKLEDDLDAAFAVAADTLPECCQFEDDDAEREDHNNYAGSLLSKTVERWLRDKHPAIFSAVVERPIDLTTMDGMTDYGKPLAVVRALTIDEYRKHRSILPLTSKPYWLATAWTTNSSPDSNGSYAYYIDTDGTVNTASCTAPTSRRVPLCILNLLSLYRLRPRTRARRWPITATRTLSTSCTAAGEAPMTRTERRRRQQCRRRAAMQRAACLALALLAVAAAFAWSGRPQEQEATETATPVTVTALPAETPTPEPITLEFEDQEAIDPMEASKVALAKMVWGEARGCSTTEQAATIWCVLNRYDSGDRFWADTVEGITTQPCQFYGYDPSNPVDPDILALVEDVLARWMAEKECVGSVGRVLPKEYLYFTGDGVHNYFTTEWQGGQTWDWSLESPYEG